MGYTVEAMSADTVDTEEFKRGTTRILVSRYKKNVHFGVICDTNSATFVLRNKAGEMLAKAIGELLEHDRPHRRH